MRKIFILSLFLLPLFVQAQDETYRFGNEVKKAETPDVSVQGEYFIVPVQDRLFTSHFNKDFLQYNDMSFEDMRAFFQQNLNKYVYQELAKHSSAVDAIAINDGKKETTLIYENVNFSYENVPVEEEELSKVDQLKSKFKKKEKEEAPKGTYVSQGQLVTNRDYAEKYLDAQVTDRSFLPLIQSFHANNYIVMLNQLELVYPTNTPQLDMQYERFQREIKVHYTVVDQNGTKVCGGLAKSYFSPEENDLNLIVEKYFPEIAKQIVMNIPAFQDVYETSTEEK